jgi:hypothetical protein
MTYQLAVTGTEYRPPSRSQVGGHVSHRSPLLP